MPRAQAARRGLGAAASTGIHRPADGQNGAFALQPVATVVCGMKPLRVLVLMHPGLVPPDSAKGYSEQEINVWKTEYDVVTTLRRAGHAVRPPGGQHELK